MPETSTIYKEEVKHVGFWSFKELYNFCYQWLKDEGYNVFEDKYIEKLSGAGKEIQIEWQAKKKISDYYRFIIKVKWHILGMNDAEVEKDGRKEKTNKGEVKITFEGILERDYEARWETHQVYKFMRSIYDKYIMRTTVDEYENRLQNKTVTFIEQVKAFLVLEGKK